MRSLSCVVSALAILASITPMAEIDRKANPDYKPAVSRMQQQQTPQAQMQQQQQTAYEDARGASPTVVRYTNFSNVGAGQSATCQLPTNITYLRSYLKFTKAGGVVATDAEVAAQVVNIKFQVDSDNPIDQAAADLQTIDAWYQDAYGVNDADNGILRIHHALQWHREIAGEDATAWGLLGRRNYAVLVTLAGGATITNVVYFAEANPGANYARHLAYRNYSYQAIAAGPFEINNFPVDVSKNLYAVFMNTDRTNISEWTLKVENRNEFDRVDNYIWTEMCETYKRKPVSGWTVFDFARRGRHQDAIPLLTQDIRLIPTFVAAPTGNTFRTILIVAENPLLN